MLYNGNYSAICCKYVSDMKIYTIVRTWFAADDSWKQTTTADSYRVVAEAKEAMLGIIKSLVDIGLAEYVGTYAFEYLMSTQKISELHATLEYQNGTMEIISIKENWLY